jgi:hypothetical protein
MLKRHDLVDKNIHISVSSPLNRCDNRIDRYVRTALDEYNYDHVIILIDSEGEDPEIIRRKIIEEHLRDIDNKLNKVSIIVAHPCLESILCKVMNLSGCETGTCHDIIRIIEQKIRREYEKKMFQTLMIKELSRRLENASNIDHFINYLPEELKKIIECFQRSHD